MNTLTHGLLPAIAAGIYNKNYNAIDQRRGLFTPNEILAIALFGAAPDLINPHLTLEARLTSWSHSLVFFVPMCLALCLAPLFFKRLRYLLVPWLIAAYALHLLCDLISGGIAWLYPLKYEFVGKFYFSAVYWIPIDFVLAAISYFLFRAVPYYKTKKLAFSTRTENL